MTVSAFIPCSTRSIHVSSGHRICDPNFVRITLEPGDQKFSLSRENLSLYSIDSVIVRLPEDLKAGDVKFTIENSDGDIDSTPVTKTFVLASR